MPTRDLPPPPPALTLLTGLRLAHQEHMPAPPAPPEPPTDNPTPAPVRHRYSRGEVALFATVGVFGLQGLAALIGAAVTGQLQMTPQAAEVLSVLSPALTGLIAFLIARLQTEEA